jgi:hypothetical protein
MEKQTIVARKGGVKVVQKKGDDKKTKVKKEDDK